MKRESKANSSYTALLCDRLARLGLAWLDFDPDARSQAGYEARAHLGYDPNERAFAPGGWLRTGDKGWLDGVGRLHLTGASSTPHHTTPTSRVEEIDARLFGGAFVLASFPCLKNVFTLALG